MSNCIFEALNRRWALYFGLLVILLVISLAGCASVRPPAGVSLDSLYATEVSEWLFGMKRVRIHSILDGPDAVLKYRSFRKRGGVMVTVAYTGEGRDEFLSSFAEAVGRIPHQIDGITGGKVGVRRIDVILVPERIGYRTVSSSWLSERGASLTFAVRDYPGDDETVHDGVRVISHEVFHLAASVLGKGTPGYANESAALTVELCSEMNLTGYVSRRFLKDPPEEWLARNAAEIGRTSSGAARYGEDRELDDLFRHGSIQKGAESATRLMDLCRSRAAALIR